jgi:hypothetical protein
MNSEVRALLAELMADDGDPAAFLETRLAAAPTAAERLRYGLALTRLWRVMGRFEAAQALLAKLEPDLVDEVEPALQRAYRLEQAEHLAACGDVQGARGALADLARGGEDLRDPALVTLQQVVAATAFASGGVPSEALRLLQLATPPVRAGIEANLRLAEGSPQGAWERLDRAIRKAPKGGRERGGLLVHRAVIELMRQEERDAVKTLREARRVAVACTDPILYLAAAMLLATAHALLRQEVEAYAAAMRGMVSLEDLLGAEAALPFRVLLDSFREGWGDERYREAAEEYVARRKRGAIE